MMLAVRVTRALITVKPRVVALATQSTAAAVERTYQRISQLEHVLLRPDSYVGSLEETTQPMWVWDEEKQTIVQREITYVPGLYKIFDEILVNAADNKIRDRKMNALKITIDRENNAISVWNNGRGIPVVMHSVEKMYIPELIFGTLLTSSNYDDNVKKVTGGRNGYGAKLCNIFSSEFNVQTSCSESKKMFEQTWTNNMSRAGKVSITDSKKDFTQVTFKPDLEKFKMTHLTDDMISLMTRRAYDLAGCTKGVAVHFNGKELPVKSFKDYVQLYLKAPEGAESKEEPARKVVHEVVSDRWEVCVTPSDNGFQQFSFVNSIATTKGGTHVKMIVDQLVPKLREAAMKKNRGGMELRPLHIKGHLWVFVNCLIENPTFDSQTKENMTLKLKAAKVHGEVSEDFVKKVLSCGVTERVVSWARGKSESVLQRNVNKCSNLRGIPKLDDASNAGGKNSLDCTLIVTEGDSAKALAVSGLSVVGRDNYGVFPLKGKLLNVQDATHTQIMKNEEIMNLTRIVGLKYGKKYATKSERNTLRYGRIMIMADQDQDGSHIKGLVINFIHHNWPELLRHGFLVQFITPIVKVTKGQRQKAFFSLPEFESWQATTDKAHTWEVNYYKGLGTSTSKEAKEYFSDMDRHRVPFHYSGQEDDQAIALAFGKKRSDDRKKWLTDWSEKQRDQGQQSLLYTDKQQSSISYSDFINKELILFSNMDNERSIPSVIDGLKRGQRKVMFTCFKRNDKSKVKVAQLAGFVAAHAAYHHGENSLMATIINLARDYVGSNNISLLQPLGQFGTRLRGGKDAASSRYIFTMLSPLARHLFVPVDENLLVFQTEDNQRIEPQWYCPIIPTVLVNGCEGIGTGYSTTVPNYNPRDIVDNIKRLMNGLEPSPMHPWYRGFTGSIVQTGPKKYAVYGNISRVDDTTVEISELPVHTWTQGYKESVLEPMLQGSDEAKPFITKYKELYTDTTVRFVVKMPKESMAAAEATGFHNMFKLESSLSTSNMVLFNKDGTLHKYKDELEILTEFFSVRLDMYKRRKQWIETKLEVESEKLNSQARFIKEKIEGEIVIERTDIKKVVEQLQARGFPSDPVKEWKRSLLTDQQKLAEEEEDHDYSYLLSMELSSLSKQKEQELRKKRDSKSKELAVLRSKTAQVLWSEDLDAFLEELDRVEKKDHKKQHHVIDSHSLIHPVVKKPKKRGRPKKSVEENGAVKEPKKRGRPKKSVEEDGAVKEPKKRGRPKKSIEEDGAVKEPKKRGRPKKSVEAAQVKEEAGDKSKGTKEAQENGKEAASEESV